MRQRTLAKSAIYGLLITAVVIATGLSFPQPSHAVSAKPLWVGTFNNGWQKTWGIQKQGQWGQSQMSTISADAGFPFPSEHVLKITYEQHSSANSCFKSGSCPPGGAQFYASPTKVVPSTGPLFLLYYLKFNNDAADKPFDWGRAGKLPGLWGGPIGSESGGNASNNAWSTRLMWRVKCQGSGSVSSPKVGGELYLYPSTQQHVMCGTASSDAVSNLGWNKWPFSADAKWHAVEQKVDPKSGIITIWDDGKQVFQVTRATLNQVPIAGIFFSTFYGGHDQTWGPHTTETAEYGHFVLDNKFIPFNSASSTASSTASSSSNSSLSSAPSTVHVA